MGLKGWWKGREEKKNEELLAWAENAQQDSSDEIAHSDIDEIRTDLGTSKFGEMSMDDSKRIE